MPLVIPWGFYMKFELDLLQNSHDYINNSFDLFNTADEYGMHDEQRTDFKNKVKWKLAYITMVQAVELLVKEMLFRIHPNLIYEDIDIALASDSKTISFSKAIQRITNLSNHKFEPEMKQFLLKGAKLRNEFIHNKVIIQSEEMLIKYCKLDQLYKDLHEEAIDSDITFYKDGYKWTEYEILERANNWTVYRGREIRKSELDEFKAEIEENSKYKYYVTKDGRKAERIRYGDEVLRVFDSERDLSLYAHYEICDECNAKKGEYHLEICDLEICPFCFGQLLSCGCVDHME